MSQLTFINNFILTVKSLLELNQIPHDIHDSSKAVGSRMCPGKCTHVQFICPSNEHHTKGKKEWMEYYKKTTRINK